MISRLDWYVGGIIVRLQESGIGDRTPVFFRSDNGSYSEGGADPATLKGTRPGREDLFRGPADYGYLLMGKLRIWNHRQSTRSNGSELIPPCHFTNAVRWPVIKGPTHL